MRSVIVAVLMLVGVVVGAQTPIGPSRDIVVFSAKARAKLAKAWDRSEWDTKQVERGYCMRPAPPVDRYYGSGQNDLELMRVHDVDSIRPAKMDTATSRLSSFSCEKGEVPLHTHPPMTCMPGPNDSLKCVHGGTDAWICMPSVSDLISLIDDVIFNRNEPWAVLQCDRSAMIVYSYHPTHMLTSDLPPETHTKQ